MLLLWTISVAAVGQDQYNLKEIDGKLVCTGFETIEGVSEEELFVKLLLWSIDQCPKFKEGLTELDFNKKSFALQSRLESPKRSENPAVYHFLADFAVSSDKLSFTFSRIECESAGMLNMSTIIAFERMKPEKKPKHKAYMEEYKKQATEYIRQLIEYLKTPQPFAVTHWDEIKRNKVEKGMNEAECLLSYGKPIEITKSDNGESRWRYDSYTYLFFKSGILTSSIE